MKKKLKRYFKILLIGLFIVSMVIQPVLARASQEVLTVQTQEDGLQLTQQAKDLYQAGQFEKAVEYWQDAATFFAQNRDPINQAMALSNLALTYQKLNQWQDAESTITQSLT
jgi:tetratricopeptide (TPR) repeat protein